MYGFASVTLDYPMECAIIGRLLAGYTGIEFGLMMCINTVWDDYDAIFKSMFRTRGETQRIEIADALGRHKFHSIQLGTEFEMAIGNMQHCRKIRNQYSHCHWIVAVPTMAHYLGFVDLEELAKANATVIGGQLTRRRLDLQLLEQQEQFFKDTDETILWLENEAEVKQGKQPQNPYSKPKQQARPPLYKP